MNSEARQKRLEELKALRAELMVYKKFSGSEEGESETSSEKIASLRKEYANKYQDIQKTHKSNYEDIKNELYFQQREYLEEKNENSQLILMRRR